MEGREWLGSPPGGFGGPPSGSEGHPGWLEEVSRSSWWSWCGPVALPVGQEWSGGPPEEQGVVRRPTQKAKRG